MSQTYQNNNSEPRENLPDSVVRTEGAQPTLLKRQALAAELDCSLRTIDHLQASGMPCIFIGRSRRFILSEVIAWLKRKGGKA